MKKIFIFIIILTNSWASEENYSEKIQKLSEIRPENYSSEVTEFNYFFDKLFEKKNFFCQGEISMLEKKKCKENIYELRVNYLNAVFIARKNYLNYLHNRRLQELEEEKRRILSTLN